MRQFDDSTKLCTCSEVWYCSQRHVALLWNVMKVLSTADMELLTNWSAARQLPDVEGLEYVTTYALPSDSGAKTALARTLAEGWSREGETFCCITGYGTWPSSENPDLFALVRLGLGSEEDIRTHPCHIFEKGEFAPLFAIASVVFYNFWDATIWGSEANLVLRVSHDEVMDVFCRDASSSAIGVKLAGWFGSGGALRRGT